MEEKNPSEFIIKWNLLNVKQKPTAIYCKAPMGGPGSAKNSRVD